MNSFKKNTVLILILVIFIIPTKIAGIINISANVSAITATASTAQPAIIQLVPPVVVTDTVSIKNFGAHSITEAGYETFDSSQAINKAIQYAAVNKISTVDFGSGKYYAKDIRLESNITYIASGKAELIAYPDIQLLHQVVLASGKNNIKIQGITINGNWDVVDGDPKAGRVLITLNNCQNVSIQNCYLYHNKYLGIQLTNNCNYITIKNNTIFDTDCGVITLGAASNNLLIDGNTIYGDKNQFSEPISIDNLISQGLAHDITITNNIVHDKIYGSGISVYNATKVVVYKNTIYNCAQGISTGNADYITITENYIHNCKYGGMSLRCSNSLIDKNSIKEIGGTGIWFMPPSAGFLNINNTISKNEIINVNSQEGNHDAGIRLEYSNNCTIDNNTIMDTRAKTLTYTNIQLSGDTNSNNIIQNNLHLGNTINKYHSIIVYKAKNTILKNNTSSILDQGTRTILLTLVMQNKNVNW